MSPSKPSPSGEFLAVERGERFDPQRGHARYQTLRLLRRTLAELIDSEALIAGETVLDFGCAERPYEPLLRDKFARYLGADLPGNAAAEVTIGPGNLLPLAAESVDAVLSTQVLEHVDDPRAYLDEAWRVLRPGGSLLLSTHGTWVYHPDPQDLWRWTVAGLRRQVEQAGFDVLSQRGVLGLGATSIQLWQDATAHRLPGLLGRAYVRALQAGIGWIEHRRDRSQCENAAIFVVLARRRERSTLAAEE